MKTLFSLPSNLVNCFHELTHKNRNDCFCTSDPVGHRIGSGGGSTWLLEGCCKAENDEFENWISKEKRLLIHAGGESRRLPGYASSGKILTPIPIFRWKKGQCINQNLISLQIPLYKKIMDKAPAQIHTLIASGDVFIRTDKPLQDIPEADVICYGLWVDAFLARNHGVFVSNRNTPEKLDFMLQKPFFEKLEELVETHLYMMDIGIWLLSDKAVELLRKHSKNDQGELIRYDLYSEFGCALGENPIIKDDELNQLSVAILPLQGGEFYHYGTSRELISSTLAIQNIVNDQTKIHHHKVKPHPAIFVQNAQVQVPLNSENSEIWIENSFIGKNWTLSKQNIITGVPENNWNIKADEGICIDIVPAGETQFVVRPYGFQDPLCSKFHFTQNILEKELFTEPIYPVCNSIDDAGKVLQWMIQDNNDQEGARIYQHCDKWSAEEILLKSNLKRLFAQRENFLAKTLPLMAKNFEKSVFYNTNLDEMAKQYVEHEIKLPEALPCEKEIMTRIRNKSLRARILQYKNLPFEEEEKEAFEILRHSLVSIAEAHPVNPQMNVYADQIVWSRSPVRIDLAGGWTDTPPYCITEGGNVVNIAIELNGQPPIQVYVKPTTSLHIVLRSIDLGAREEIHAFDDIRAFNKVGSPFSIPKAALALAGFVPEFCLKKYNSLTEQLKALGCGLELTLLAAIPAGSGLGTSSVLSATTLAALSNFCDLGWDKVEVCNRTLILEQLLTTGGGWQDQFGGIMQGVKLLQTNEGFNQTPLIKWLPDTLFTQTEYQKCHLLYYTGITRTAKNILAEIVRGMFLNQTEHVLLLGEMKQHALDLFDAIQRNNYIEYGKLIAKTWKQNQSLDAGTNPKAVQEILDKVSDMCLGYKLPGAGGGGFIYMVAKDPDAAAKIKMRLEADKPNDKARFVQMSLSHTGLQTSRS
jgi:Predicted kinase related to galactokinase and mevalonate kinase